MLFPFKSVPARANGNSFLYFLILCFAICEHIVYNRDIGWKNNHRLPAPAPKGETRQKFFGEKGTLFRATVNFEKANQSMRKIFRPCLSLFLTLSLLTALPLAVAADGENPYSPENITAEAESGLLGSVTDRDPTHYPSVTVKLGRARLAMKGLYILGVPYLPLYELLDAFTETSMRESGTAYTFTASGMTAHTADGSYYIEANGRYFYMQVPIVKMRDGALYVPMQSAVKVVGISASYHAASRTVTLSGSYRAPVSGASFYREDAVYWLSRIISAESRGEPMLGQIAVGNVVLNRVNSPSFPNTIWGVIFDKKYGVQFAPTQNGTIYQAPAESSVIAAKICLEGFSINTEILYFYEPVHAVSSWIENNRPYAFTIKNHRFFK